MFVGAFVMYVWRTEDSLGCHFSIGTLYFFFETGSLAGLELKAGQAGC